MYPGGAPPVPGAGTLSPSVRALFLSLLALAVPVSAAFLFPQDLEHYEALLWLLALVPAFLLAYQRGWKGAATALALGMAALSITYASTQVLGKAVPETLFPVVVAYLAITLGLGWFGQELEGSRELARQPLRILDPETELPTWAYAERYLEGEFEAARRGRPLVLAVFEIAEPSRPGSVEAGADQEILRFAEVLRRNTRSMNVSARQSGTGGRFVSTLSGGSLEGAMLFAQRVLQGYHGESAAHPARPVSAGVAAFRPELASTDDLLAAAAGALSDAIEAGGDRVRAAGTILERVRADEAVDEESGAWAAAGAGIEAGAGGAGGGPSQAEELRLQTTPASRRQTALVVGHGESLKPILDDLERRRIQVAIADTAAAAAGSLHHDYDLVVVDAGEEGAVQLVRSIQRNGRLTQVLVTCGSGSSTSAVAALNAGAAHCLLESVDESAVGAAVDVVLERRDRALRESMERTQLADEMGARRREAQRTLREAEARYRTVVEGMNEVVFQVDLEGRCTFLNAAWEKHFTTSLNDALGAPLTSGIHPDDRRVVERELDALFQGRTDQLHTHARIAGTSSRDQWVALSASPSFNSAGALTGAFGTIVEITERRTLEEQLRQAQKMEAVGQLAGGIAHDFNNLLMAIRSHAEFVLEDAAPEGEAREDLRQILAGADRAADLTRQLLAFSRKQVLEAKVLDLGVTLRGMEGMLRRLLGEDIDIGIDLPDTPPTIEADEGQIQQVVLNLAVNARDAMPGGGRLIFRIDNLDYGPDSDDPGPPNLDPGRYVCLAVQDSGSGMSPETADRIFEPFFTTKDQGQGTGLGLATVYGIVTQSGGHIHVASREGMGSTFHAYFPRVEPTGETDSAPEDEQPRRGSGETILVVEDEDGVRSVLERILERNGYRVITAATAREALELVADDGLQRIDLLLSDVVMPEMSGVELSERLTERRPSLPVLFMSGYAEEEMIQRGHTMERVLLEKPFIAADLLKAIDQSLRAPA